MKYTVKISNLSFEMEIVEIKEVVVQPVIQEPENPIVEPEPVLPEVVEPEVVIPTQPEIAEPEVVEPQEPEIVTPEIIQPEDQFDWSKAEIIEFTEEFYRLVNTNQPVTHIYLQEGKIYRMNRVQRRMLMNRGVRLHSGPKGACFLGGPENYNPLVHGENHDNLFTMAHNSWLVLDNVHMCLPPQLKTVQPYNPRIFHSLDQHDVQFGVVIRNCDTTILGKNGGWGTGFSYGHEKENHTALINFKHWGVGLMDAKNPRPDQINYVTLRNVEASTEGYGRIAKVSFEHIGTLKDGILTFDGSTYQLTAGYNWNWTKSNQCYIVHQDRFTFFLDGHNADTVVSVNQFKVRPQAKGICEFGVLDANKLFSNAFEMHAGDTFLYEGIEYTVVEKDRIAYPFFSSETAEAIKEPQKVKALVYTVDKDLPVSSGVIHIDYLGEVREFTDAPITLLYRSNGKIRTTLSTKYRHPALITADEIGHLFYYHFNISMDGADSKLAGFFRGSKNGNGKSILWNLYNCTGFDINDPYFMTALPVTNIPNLPLHTRIEELLNK